VNDPAHNTTIINAGNTMRAWKIPLNLIKLFAHPINHANTYSIDPEPRLITPCRPSSRKELKDIFKSSAPLKISRGLLFLLEQKIHTDFLWVENKNREALNDNSTLFYACRKFAYIDSYGITPKHVFSIKNILLRRHHESPILVNRVHLLISEVETAIADIAPRTKEQPPIVVCPV